LQCCARRLERVVINGEAKRCYLAFMYLAYIRILLRHHAAAKT
jgi:hypothetical protein